MKNNETQNETALRTLLLVLGLALSFLLWGLFLYITIGDKGSPTWSFGALDDVPGLSPYSTAGPQEAPSLRPSPLQNGGPVRGQHIMGPDQQPSPESGGTP